MPNNYLNINFCKEQKGIKFSKNRNNSLIIHIPHKVAVLTKKVRQEIMNLSRKIV